jgi:hypothetical protein
MEIGCHGATASMRTRAYAPRLANDTAEIWLSGPFQEMWQLRKVAIRAAHVVPAVRCGTGTSVLETVLGRL